jgi:hypothetical protein
MHIGVRFDYTSGKMERGAALSEPMHPEEFWNRLLSKDPDLIRSAWKTLKAEEREIVRSHLRRMAQEEGWQTGQRLAARAALDCLENLRDG